MRNERLKIKLTEEKKALFEEKRKLAKCRNMSHFIRKWVLEKEIYQVDLEHFRNLQGLQLLRITFNSSKKIHEYHHKRLEIGTQRANVLIKLEN